MRVDNRTSYSTRSLRTIFCAVHRATAPRHRRWDRVVVKVAYSRRGDRSYTGWAYCPGTSSHISIPRGGLDVPELVAIWRHELLHLIGFGHADMNDSQLWSRTGCDFVRDVVVGVGSERLDEVPRAEKPPRPTLEEKRAAEVGRLLARRGAWVTKARRAETALGKIDARLRLLSRSGIEIPDLEPSRKVAASKRKR